MSASFVPLPLPSADVPNPRPFASISDLEAIAEVARGNREVFEVIVRRYNQQLYRVGMAYLQDHGAAEDAMQNTYVKAFLKLGDYQGGAAFSTWLTRIMINECLMILRHRRSRPEASLDATLHGDNGRPYLRLIDEADESVSPLGAQIINHQEMKVLLEHAIAALPRKYRAVYVLREIQQLSTTEAAAALGVSTASIKVDLHRARERLKAEILRSAAGAELFAYPAFFCDPMTTRVMRAISGA